MTSDTRGLPLTPRQRRALAELAIHGSYGEAADCMQITPSTFRGTVSTAYGRLGVVGGIEAFRAMGWLAAPTHTAFYADLGLVWR